MSNRSIRQAVNSAPERDAQRFGRRSEPSYISVSRNGRVHHIRVNPIAAAFGVGILCMFAVGYFTATAYLMLRDDLIGMTQARSARLLHEYEDRIAMLRANLDRVTSRQLLDQQAIEAKVSALMQRQEMLGGQNSRLGKLLETAKQQGLSADGGTIVPVPATPAPDPVTTGSTDARLPGQASLQDFSMRGTEATRLASLDLLVIPAKPDISDLTETHTMFENITDRIDSVDLGQRAMLARLRDEAAIKSSEIVAVLKKLDLGDELGSAAGIGGPYVPLDPDLDFDMHVDALDLSLKALGKARSVLDAAPVANPAPGAPFSSGFGMRTDPFLGTPAMHSGLDFRAQAGTPVLAAASGKVVDAGRNGGYGNMVEIDHGNGVTTRYAHLNRISVATGDRIARGEKVGEVGSTGRSTGPHLHYEVRRHGNALDPLAFIRAARDIPGGLL